MKKALQLLNKIQHGGGENVAMNYAKVLRELGVESVFIGKRTSAEYEAQISTVGTIQETLRFSDIRTADYLFVHTNKNLLKLFFLYLIPLKVMRKKVFYLQHLQFPEKKFRLLAFFINAVCTDFIQITPITKTLVDKYINIRKRFIVNFYISRYNKADYPSIRNSVRAELEIPEDKILVMFSAVFKPGKGLGDFLEVAARFAGRQAYYFLLIGDGPEAEMARQYKFPNLKWVGFVNDVEKYLIASDVYFFSSVFKQEMLPMALVEAINAEKKIIAYNTAINHFLLEGHTCESIQEMEAALLDQGGAKTFPHFDKQYALGKIGEII
ncbi:glycosyltransferase involved in cell wall biosynthesis [Chitinophaga terrae (ex Kim and Jung 2007)]|uniref:glycosyltransferase family 4 protein n=1 Tax=Chitinophaga terrae (ex Kim and Jung 2007) TaxID=408074 RepID=UPI0027825B64|nr:glycosyltransferase family 4 protein [Chitinophaga terrae (ex Kim and Jung 2007)]MDQ0105773.1 glycosyltransferase involved in cell wall biosynthesis [Chitinophaga terrae (ex Kim and Jung 2007)]